MSGQALWIALGWLALVFFAVGGLLLIVAQTVLPAAREAIKAQPPRGPRWARLVWYGRNRLYGSVLALAAGAGLLAFLIALGTSTH